MNVDNTYPKYLPYASPPKQSIEDAKKEDKSSWKKPLLTALATLSFVGALLLANKDSSKPPRTIPNLEPYLSPLYGVSEDTVCYVSTLVVGTMGMGGASIAKKNIKKYLEDLYQIYENVNLEITINCNPEEVDLARKGIHQLQQNLENRAANANPKTSKVISNEPL